MEVDTTTMSPELGGFDNNLAFIEHRLRDFIPLLIPGMDIDPLALNLTPNRFEFHKPMVHVETNCGWAAIVANLDNLIDAYTAERVLDADSVRRLAEQTVNNLMDGSNPHDTAPVSPFFLTAGSAWGAAENVVR